MPGKTCSALAKGFLGCESGQTKFDEVETSADERVQRTRERCRPGQWTGSLGRCRSSRDAILLLAHALVALHSTRSMGVPTSASASGCSHSCLCLGWLLECTASLQLDRHYVLSAQTRFSSLVRVWICRAVRHRLPSSSHMLVTSHTYTRRCRKETMECVVKKGT
jgi:hypothetical protein